MEVDFFTHTAKEIITLKYRMRRLEALLLTEEQLADFDKEVEELESKFDKAREERKRKAEMAYNKYPSPGLRHPLQLDRARGCCT